MNKAIYIWAVSCAVWISFCCWAQYSGDAWTAYRGFSTNTVTNLQAFLVTDVWSRTSTTNLLPVTDIPANFPNKYISIRNDSLVGTNVNAGITTSIANVYYLDIRKQDPSWTQDGTNWVSNNQFPSDWTNTTWLAKYGTVNETTNIEYEVVNDGVTNTYEVALEFDRTHHVYYGTNAATQVEMPMNYDARRQLDLYFAVNERRISASGGDNMIFFFDRYDNISNLKNTLGGLLPDYHYESSPRGSYVIPMTSYADWFFTPRGHDSVTRQSWYDWQDTNADGTNDTWVETRPDHFPHWTEATFCMSNNLPIQLVTNTVTNTSVRGWKYGEMSTYDSGTNEVTYEEVEWGASYFDLTSPKNYFNLGATYHQYIGTNEWTLTWEENLELYETWLDGSGLRDYGDTNDWEMMETRMDHGMDGVDYYPHYDFTLYLCASTNTNSIVSNLYVRVDQETDTSETVITKTIYEDNWTNNYTNVVSVVLTNDYIAKGYDITDYDIHNLPDALNSLKWRETKQGGHDWETDTKYISDSPYADYYPIFSGAYRNWDENDQCWDPECQGWAYYDPYGWNVAKDNATNELKTADTNSAEMAIWSHGRGIYGSDYSDTSSYQHRSWDPLARTAKGRWRAQNDMRVEATAEIWMGGYAPDAEEQADDLYYGGNTLTNYNAVYDDFGLNIPEDTYEKHTTIDISPLVTVTSQWIQTSGGITDIPTWAADPDPHSDVTYDYNNDNGFYFEKNTFRGLEIKQPRVLMKYDVTNGFEYIEGE